MINAYKHKKVLIEVRNNHTNKPRQEVRNGIIQAANQRRGINLSYQVRAHLGILLPRPFWVVKGIQCFSQSCSSGVELKVGCQSNNTGKEARRTTKEKTAIITLKTMTMRWTWESGQNMRQDVRKQCFEDKCKRNYTVSTGKFGMGTGKYESRDSYIVNHQCRFLTTKQPYTKRCTKHWGSIAKDMPRYNWQIRFEC
jgi:hypothetical protein